MGEDEEGGGSVGDPGRAGEVVEEVDGGSAVVGNRRDGLGSEEGEGEMAGDVIFFLR